MKSFQYMQVKWEKVEDYAREFDELVEPDDEFIGEYGEWGGESYDAGRELEGLVEKSE